MAAQMATLPKVGDALCATLTNEEKTNTTI